MELEKDILSQITVYMKYSRYLKDKNRRETWEELVQRNKEMHLKKYQNYPELKQTINSIYNDFVLTKKVLPSMRGLQFAGKAIEVNPTRIYNCAFLPINSIESFSETMFLLLSGCGVGFSVQKHHIEELPEIKKPNPKRTYRYLISDNIEGWADSIKILLKSYFGHRNSTVEFDFSDIRQKGAELVTSGGKAPGAQPLKECLLKVEGLLNSKKENSKLKPIDCHDIQCHIADAVLAGGIRRAAMISLFSFDDEEMVSAKSGDWWEMHPERGRANNSAIILRHRVNKQDFNKFWEKIKNSGSGEPGFIFSNDKDMGFNPCFTGDTIVAVADGRNGVSIKQLAEESGGKIKFPVYSSTPNYFKNNLGENRTFRKWKTEIKNAIAFKTGNKKIIKIVLSDGSNFECTPKHQLARPDGSYIEAKNSLGVELEKFYSFSDKNTNKSYRHINSKSNGYSRQYRMIWEFYEGKYDGKLFNVDHIDDDSTNDLIGNLELLNIENHKNKTKRFGENNPIHKVSSNDYLKAYTSRSSIKANGVKYGWSEKEIQEALFEWDDQYGKLLENLKPCDVNVYFDDKVFVKEIVDEGKVEDVYDLTVDDNHNFYIITKTDDDRYLNSSGVLVHNCAEISLRPFQFCNLVEINALDIDNQEELNKRSHVASILATLQASYTNFHYLREIWRRNTEKDALIGVSMTGIASGGVLNLDLKQAANIVVETNKIYSEMIGINQAARTTCIKPAGTTSLVLGTSSGIHAWHNDYYIRRIRVSKNEAMYNFLSIMHPELVTDDMYRPHDTAVIEIPQKSPENAILRHESAIDLLERIKYVNQNWINPGHNTGSNQHNVSATISIKDGEWELVKEWMWVNRDYYNGLSILPYDTGTYKQTPFEDITKQKYEELVKSLVEVNVEHIIEEEDATDLVGELACGGGKCEIT